MSQDSTRPDVGQEAAVSAETPERTTKSTDELMAVLERQTRAIIRFGAILTMHDARMKVMERKLGYESDASISPWGPDDEPPTEPAPVVIPPLALRCDGRVLLHTADIEGVDLDSFERWEGIVLSEAEAADVQMQLSHGFSEAAGTIGGWILKRSKKRDGES